VRANEIVVTAVTPGELDRIAADGFTVISR
jgi:hypothetical protein